MLLCIYIDRDITQEDFDISISGSMNWQLGFNLTYTLAVEQKICVNFRWASLRSSINEGNLCFLISSDSKFLKILREVCEHSNRTLGFIAKKILIQ